MSSRLLTKEQSPQVRPFAWPALHVVPPMDAPPPQLDQARLALAEAASDAGKLRQRVDELESALHSREQLGFEKGFAEGLNKGRQESTEHLRPVLERMSRAIADTAMLRPRLRMESEADLIRLCTAIAHRILKRELHMDPLALEGIVQAALARAGSVEIFRVRAHPAHADEIRVHLSKLGVPESVRVEPAMSLDEGDLLIETSAGQIDASVNTQIAEVERGLTANVFV
jgi:flagellar biosynthesis/type III secretory pathway protein FliH